MMYRDEIKEIGKEQFKSNYWNCVLVLLLTGAVLSLITWLSGGGHAIQTISERGNVTVSVRANAGSLLALLLFGPLTIGTNYFFIKNAQDERDELSVTTPFSQAFQNYPRKLGGSLWMGLFVFLWSLLLVIPGIIKAFSYSMTPYILADCPKVKARDALKISMDMMEGHKWEAFVLLLSFIGWILLSLLTFGLAAVFYVTPYMRSTMAVYYQQVREDALRRGVVTPEELDGSEPV